MKFILYGNTEKLLTGDQLSTSNVKYSIINKYNIEYNQSDYYIGTSHNINTTFYYTEYFNFITDMFIINLFNLCLL